MAKRSLGQHFLIDRAVARAIADLCELQPGDGVVEIGPGRGALTRHLLEKDARVIAVEKDERLARQLARRFEKRLQVLEADALLLDLDAIRAQGRWVAVGNLPFNVSLPIFFRLLKARCPWERLVLMFQKEVGQRIVAEAGSRTYGVPSVITALFGSASVCLNVKAQAFTPRPKVDAAVVRVDTFRAPIYDLDVDRFENMLGRLFQYRRKMLRNVLRRSGLTSGDQADSVLKRARIDGRLRPEALALEHFYLLYCLLGLDNSVRI